VNTVPQSAIQGLGWVTPLGRGLGEVWDRWQTGERGAITDERGHACMRVPPALVAELGKNPRLRRSSPITYFTAAAGLDALEDAGLSRTPELAARTALVFGVSTGSVVYTRKFHEQIVTQGAGAASPLLFPETVYNAATSHLAALLGIEGRTYTLVGDASAGLSALHFATQLLATTDAERVLVVAGEELDSIVCRAYTDWRINTVFSEGAAAVVLGREGPLKVRTHPGVPFFSRKVIAAATHRVIAETLDGARPDVVTGSANGTFIDAAEKAALDALCANTPALFPKQALGESLGAAGLIQVVAAAMSLRKQNARCSLVSSLGFNQQAGAALLEQM
jgi:3-oxoacyl-(acyl-carrier-protein) synthase